MPGSKVKSLGLLPHEDQVIDGDTMRRGLQEHMGQAGR